MNSLIRNLIIEQDKRFTECTKEEKREIKKEIKKFENLNDKNEYHFLDYKCDGYIEDEVTKAVCPVCEREFDYENEEHYLFCPSCGTKLKWEE